MMIGTEIGHEFGDDGLVRLKVFLGARQASKNLQLLSAKVGVALYADRQLHLQRDGQRSEVAGLEH